MESLTREWAFLVKKESNIFVSPSSQALRFFEKNGFCLFRWENREHAELVSSSYDFFSKPLNRQATDFQVESGDGRHIPRIFRDKGSRVLEIFQQSLVQETIGAFFPAESRDNLFYTHSKLSVKSKSQNTGWSPHQDSGYKKHPDRHSGLSVVCALEDMDEQNGCLHICPGSHKNGPLKHSRVIGAKGEGDGQLEVTCFDIVSGIPIIAKAGDIIIFDLNTVHYSENPESDSNRLAVITEVERMEWYQLDADRRPPIPVIGNTSKRRKVIMFFITLMNPSFYAALLRESSIGRLLRKYFLRLKARQWVNYLFK